MLRCKEDAYLPNPRAASFVLSPIDATHERIIIARSDDEAVGTLAQQSVLMPAPPPRLGRSEPSPFERCRKLSVCSEAIEVPEVALVERPQTNGESVHLAIVAPEALVVVAPCDDAAPAIATRTWRWR